jgi:hypothetical protein
VSQPLLDDLQQQAGRHAKARHSKQGDRQAACSVHLSAARAAATTRHTPPQPPQRSKRQPPHALMSGSWSSRRTKTCVRQPGPCCLSLKEAGRQAPPGGFKTKVGSWTAAQPCQPPEEPPPSGTACWQAGSTYDATPNHECVAGKHTLSVNRLCGESAGFSQVHELLLSKVFLLGWTLLCLQTQTTQCSMRLQVTQQQLQRQEQQGGGSLRWQPASRGAAAEQQLQPKCRPGNLCVCVLAPKQESAGRGKVGSATAAAAAGLLPAACR